MTKPTDIRDRLTAPAASLDADQTLDAAREVIQGRDAHWFECVATQYAFGCQRAALADLALRVREGTDVPAVSGWKLVTGATRQAPNVINMLLHHPKESGGWLVQVEYDQPLTENAFEQVKRLEEASGKSIVENLLEPLPEVEAIKATSSSYVPLAADTPLKGLAIRAIDMGNKPAYGLGGIPYGAEKERTDHVSDLGFKTLNLDDYSRGKICYVEPPEVDFSLDGHRFKLGSQKFLAAPAFIVLRHLQDILGANGLGPVVDREAARHSTEPFRFVGAPEDEAVANAAIAMVHADGGRITSRSDRFASALEQAALARDLERDVEQIDALVNGLREEGRFSKEDAFRTSYENAWLERDGDREQLMLQTESGKFTFAIAWGDRAIDIQCTEEGGRSYPVAHFLRSGGALQGAWSPAGEGVVIPFLPENIRRLNTVCIKLPSVALMYDDELMQRSAPAP